jgi:CheY-like chemotaxis protein
MTYEVVLVDDDESTRLVYHEILSRMKFEVYLASDGVNAVELLSRRVPHVVILDLLLPRKSGREVLDYIYSSPHLDGTRVIIFTAHDSLPPIDLRQGDVFLLKPLNPQSLRDAVQRAVTLSTVKH